MARMTHTERRERTRTCLMASAARLFAKRGLQQTSIEGVAEDAGYTKGAFYANFKNKEELFLAMLDERFAGRIAEIERRIAAGVDPADGARRVGDDLTRVLDADPEWERLFFEFSAHAVRDEEFRQEFATRYAWMRQRVAAALAARAEELGIQAPLPFDQIAVMTCAMANGVALERLVDGDAVPDDTYGTMLMVFFAGLQALAPARADG